MLYGRGIPALLACLLALQASAKEVKQVASDGAAGDWFGFWTGISGDYAIVGAPHANVGVNAQQGAAYVFYRNQGGMDKWGEIKKLVASDGAAYDHFGYTFAISGDYAIIGADRADVGVNADQGAAYVFYRNQGGPDNWGQVVKLVSSDGAAYDLFGEKLSISSSGDSVIVTALWADIGANADQGAAYVFYRNWGGPDNWGQVKKLISSDGAASDQFGAYVEISGTCAVVGANYADVSGKSDQGAAYIFYRDQGGADNWGQVKKLIASDGAAGDCFGHWSTIVGNTVIVGAQTADVGANSNQGAAYVFYRDQGGADNWGQVKKLVASDGAADDNFGISIAISGDGAIIGAPYGDDKGSAYTFGRNVGGPDNWGQAAKYVASDGAAGDCFGYTVGLSGLTAVVGAYWDDIDANADQGSVYFLFDVTVPVEMVAFTASAAAEGVTLEWSTASEVANSHFLVERARDSEGPWQRIGTIPGAGSSPFWHDYRFVDRTIEPGAVYWYLLSDVSYDGAITRHGPIEVAVPSVGRATALHANAPNPFNPLTMIRFTLAEAGPVTLTIHNEAGQVVRTLVADRLGPGTHEFAWDGRDSQGKPVASGAYIYRLTSRHGVQARRMVLIR